MLRLATLLSRRLLHPRGPVGITLLVLMLSAVGLAGVAFAQQLQTIYFAPQASAPVTCNAGNKGALYFSSSDNKLQVCDGSAWAAVGGTATISAGNVSSGSFGSNTGGGNYTFPGNLTVDTDTLFVDATNNRVGAGTTTPATTLEIVGSADELLRLSRGSATSTKFRVGADGALVVQNQTTDVLTIKSGNLGVGDTSPAALLTVGSGDLFQVISTGEARGIAGAVGAPSFSFTGDTNTGMYSGGVDILRLATAGADRVTVDASGNVGIGDTSPDYELDILTAAGSDPKISISDGDVSHGFTSAAQADTAMLLHVNSPTAGGGLITGFSDTDAVGLVIRGYIGSIDPTNTIPAVQLRGGKLDGTGIAALNSSEIAIQFSGHDGITDFMTILSGNGNIGIGTDAPSQTLHVAGTVRITASVVVSDDRTLCTTSVSGEIEFVNGACGTSSLRYKENVLDLGYGLPEILRLRPVFFNYLKDATTTDDLTLKDDRTKRRIGFIAEEMQEVIPEVIIWQNGQVENIDYANLTTLNVRAIQELNLKIEDLATNTEPAPGSFADKFFQNLFTKIKTWLADTANGIAKIFTDKLVAKELCVEDVCVTRDQFLQMVQQAGIVASP